MEERPESDGDDVELELTPEQQVAADEAMLLDLGEAEELADEIAEQSLGRKGGTSGPTPWTAAEDQSDDAPGNA